MVFDLGMVHADPHPGNILVRDAPKAPQGFEVVLAFKNSVSIPVVILRPAGWVRSLLAKLPLPGAP